MANDAQGYYSNLCHFSFVCWFKKMPQIKGRRKMLTLKAISFYYHPVGPQKSFKIFEI